MDTINNIYLILIAILALGIAIFQYFYNVKKQSKKQYIFATLRFFTLFFLGVLLLNPKFNQTVIHWVKPSLVIVVDNSNSIKKLNQTNAVQNFITHLKNSTLSNQFTIDYYSFGKEFKPLDSLTFNETQTNIANVFSSLKEIYKNTLAPTILLTDGNQTFGEDYILNSRAYKQEIYPVVLGDSVLKTDLKISHVQHNKYAFLGNEFPLEITLNYVGKKAVSQELTVFNGAHKIISKKINFSTDNHTQIVNVKLKANQVGKQYYTVKITTLSSEENKVNNIRNFNISIIDERTKVLLVSAILHPDLGALKKAIETNKQRKVTTVKPTDVFDINKYQMIIVYQPSSKFKETYSKLKEFQKNYLTITGLQTDWAFLNSVSSSFKRKVITQKQEYLAHKNEGFSLFQYDDLSFETYPPLLDFYGDLELQTNANTILYQQIGNVVTKSALLTFFEQNNRREALLIGEGIWKWRAKSFLNTKNFETFDAFIGKMIQFLASNTKKQRLVVDAEDQYYLGETRLDAQYYDKNYQLNSNEILKCDILNTKTNQKYTYDFSNTTTNYALNLNNLPAGTYKYTVRVVNKVIVKKGSFEVLDFNIEAQFLNADIKKLQQLAANTTNKLYFSNQYKQLFNELSNKEQYKTVQEDKITQKPLIHWKYLLSILLLLLSIEWLMRKYNGLI